MGIVIANEAVVERLVASGKLEHHILIGLPKQPFVDERIADHADLSAFVGNRIYIAPNLYDVVYDRLSKTFDEKWLMANLIKGNRVPEKGYPMDIPYNCVSISDHLFHNLKYTDSSIIEGYSGKRININQGYAKCSCLLVGTNGAITEDPGIEKALTSCGVDVLLISRGGVLLKGFDYGFIGGAGGTVDSTLYMNGKLSSHPDYHHMEPFIARHGVELVELNSGPLVDCGSILYYE